MSAILRMSDSQDRLNNSTESQHQGGEGRVEEEEDQSLVGEEQDADIESDLSKSVPMIIEAVTECANNITAELSKGFESNKPNTNIRESFLYLQSKLVSTIEKEGKKVTNIDTKIDQVLSLMNKISTAQTTLSAKVTNLSSEINSMQAKVTSATPTKTGRKDQASSRKSKAKVNQKPKVPRFDPRIPTAEPLQSPPEDCPYGYIPESLLD